MLRLRDNLGCYHLSNIKRRLYLSPGALEQLPFFKYSTDSGIPIECATIKQRMAAEFYGADYVDRSSTFALPVAK